MDRKRELFERQRILRGGGRVVDAGIVTVDERGVMAMPKSGAVTDQELIDNQVSLGQPRWCAEQLRGKPELRALAFQMWEITQRANRGDPSARGAVDVARGEYDRMRREQLISDVILPNDYSMF